jgi:polysaccharide biosynthesis protein PslH
MNILFLAPRLPWPLDTGGRLRTFNLFKQLSKIARMHMVSFSFEARDEEWKKEIEKLGVKVTLVPAQESSSLERVWDIAFNSLPHSIAKYQKSSMRSTLENLSKSEHFDALHIDHIHMAYYNRYFKGIPCFLDAHNVEYKIWERCGEVEPMGIKKLLYYQQSSKMKTYEAIKTKEFKGVFTCSSDDQKFFKDITSVEVPLYVIPNGVDTEFNAPDPSQGSNEEEAIVFTGSMNWLPNEDAITFFCDKILPLIWKKKASVKFYVVGKNPSLIIKDLAQHDQRVIITGRVEDVRPYIRRARVSIVPLRIGGGTRLKILEAMALSQAIVSTSIGAEGIEYTDGKNILIGDSPQDFADKILLVLNDPQRSREIGIEARKFVCGKYDWNIIGQKLKTIYEESVHA